MKTQIKLNNQISADLEKLIEGGMVILANSGGGKSYAIRRIAEQAVPNVQVIILDPEGEFASLREKFDFILCGKDADVPVETRSAALLATKLLELNKSAIIDLYELHPQERQRYVKLFCESLVNCPKELYHPVLIILDEAHEYVPEGKPSEATWAVESLASKGRKRGQRLILASQRISKLSKNASAECNNKLIGRASQDIDMKRAGDELGFNKEKIMELRKLKPGEFFVFGPAISDDVQKVQIGEVKTSHAKSAYSRNTKTPPPSNVIKKVLAELKDLPQEAQKQATTVADLKKENTELKREITIMKNRPLSIDKAFMDREIAEAVRLAEMRKDAEFWKEKEEWLKQIQNWFDILEGVGKMMVQFKKDQKVVLPKVLSAMIEVPKVVERKDLIIHHFGETSTLSVGEKAILNAIAQYPGGITTEHIAILTGYKQTSRRVYLQKLVASGYARKEGDIFHATEAGMEILGDDFKPLPTGAALREHWAGNLPEGERKIFNALIDAHPVMLYRQEIQEMTGYKATSVRVYVQKLIARKIVIQDGPMLKLSDTLF